MRIPGRRRTTFRADPEHDSGVRRIGFRAEAEHFSADPGMVFDLARNDFHR
jgi:hypothetical protein